MVAEEASPLVLGRVVLKHVKKPGGKNTLCDILIQYDTNLVFLCSHLSALSSCITES